MKACGNDRLIFLEAVDGYTARELAEERGGTRGSWQGLISRSRKPAPSRGGSDSLTESEPRAFCLKCRVWSGRAHNGSAKCFRCGEIMRRDELMPVPKASLLEALANPMIPEASQ